MDRECREPEVEIVSKQALLHSFPEKLVRRGDEAKVAAYRFIGSHGCDFTEFQRPQ